MPLGVVYCGFLLCQITDFAKVAVVSLRRRGGCMLMGTGGGPRKILVLRDDPR